MSTEAGATGPDGNHLIYGDHFGECSVVFHDFIWEKKRKNITTIFSVIIYSYDLDIFRCPSYDLG
jgi:hypothetical protein